MELLTIRRDDGQAQYLSVDTHIEELISNLDTDEAVKESFSIRR